MTEVRRRARGRSLAIGLAASLVGLVLASMIWGPSMTFSAGDAARALGAMVGLGEPVAVHHQAILELRLWRAVTAAGVGAALALSGALLQGIFRNGLASPTIIGVTSGANLGAAAAILVLGGYASSVLAPASNLGAPLLVAAAAFVGALLATSIVVVLASTRGRLSVPVLLLTGIAVNSTCAGLLAALQALTLENHEVVQAILAWNFGNLDDRSGAHAAVIWGALAAAALAIPFLRHELDLFAGGEDDAESLGVSTRRVKALAIVMAALLGATAVSVAGMIAFIGLVVPHVLRLVSGSSYRTLLPLAPLGGGVFLVGTELLQRALLGDSALRPGALMSIVGGPLFIALLVRQREVLRSW